MWTEILRHVWFISTLVFCFDKLVFLALGCEVINIPCEDGGFLRHNALVVAAKLFYTHNCVWRKAKQGTLLPPASVLKCSLPANPRASSSCLCCLSRNLSLYMDSISSCVVKNDYSLRLSKQNCQTGRSSAFPMICKPSVSEEEGMLGGGREGEETSKDSVMPECWWCHCF